MGDFVAVFLERRSGNFNLWVSPRERGKTWVSVIVPITVYIPLYSFNGGQHVSYATVYKLIYYISLSVQGRQRNAQGLH